MPHSSCEKYLVIHARGAKVSDNYTPRKMYRKLLARQEKVQSSSPPVRRARGEAHTLLLCDGGESGAIAGAGLCSGSVWLFYVSHWSNAIAVQTA